VFLPLGLEGWMLEPFPWSVTWVGFPEAVCRWRLRKQISGRCFFGGIDVIGPLEAGLPKYAGGQDSVARALDCGQRMVTPG